MRLDGYIRVSRVGGREGEGYISPEVQRDAILGYAAELGGAIVEWHDDQDFSGGNTERPGFQRVLERIKGDETDGIVVMRIDRFARSVADGAATVREIVDRGKVFAACYERIDPRTPEGTFMLNSFLNNAELFLNQSKANWITAKSRAVARGVHIGPTPIGYMRKPSQPLEVDPVYGPAITALFNRAASGKYGDTALTKWMNDQHPPESRRGWQTSEIRRWLGNRLYLGRVKYGDLVNDNAHPPLTDPETWQRCQREARLQRKAHSRFLLSGLVRCAACRYSMGGQTYGGHNATKPVYRCTNRTCPSPAVMLTRLVDAYVRDVTFDYTEILSASRSLDDADLRALDLAVVESETEFNLFAVDLEARRLLGEEGWHDALRVRAADREAKTRARDVAYAQVEAAALRLRFKDLDFHRLRDFLRHTVRAVYIRRGRGAPTTRCLIEFVDHPDPFDLPGPHRSGPFEPIDW